MQQLIEHGSVTGQRAWILTGALTTRGWTGGGGAGGEGRVGKSGGGGDRYRDFRAGVRLKCDRYATILLCIHVKSALS